MHAKYFGVVGFQPTCGAFTHTFSDLVTSVTAFYSSPDREPSPLKSRPVFLRQVTHPIALADLMLDIAAHLALMRFTPAAHQTFSVPRTN